MPTTIIHRPDYIGNAISTIIDDAQAQARADEEKRRQEHEKKKKLGLTIGGAVAGAGIGLVAAPMLGMAGAAAGSTATTGVGAGISSIAAPTIGALGTGGTLSGLGALSAATTGASLGSQVGQAIDSGDITPALATAANLTNSIVQDRETRRVFGYSATPQERALYAHAAISQGTDLASMIKVAQSGGPSVSSQVATAHAAGMNLEELNQLARRENLPMTGMDLSPFSPAERTTIIQGYRTQAAQGRLEGLRQANLQKNRDDTQASIDRSVSLGLAEYAPDNTKIAEVQKQLAAANNSLATFVTSGGADGWSLAELQPVYARLNRELDEAQKGQTRPVQPKFPVYENGKQTGEIPAGFSKVGNRWTFTRPGANGKTDFTSWEDKTPPPIRVQETNGKVQEYPADYAPLPGGGAVLSDRVKFIPPTQNPEEKDVSDFNKNFWESVNKGGPDAPKPEDYPARKYAFINSKRVDRLVPKVEQLSRQFADGLVGPEDIASALREASILFGSHKQLDKDGNPTGKTISDIPVEIAEPLSRMDRTLRDQQQKEAIYRQSQIVGPPESLAPSVPPPGSAAAVESEQAAMALRNPEIAKLERRLVEKRQKMAEQDRQRLVEKRQKMAEQDRQRKEAFRQAQLESDLGQTQPLPMSQYHGP